MISRTLKAAGVSSLALLACMPNPSTAQFGVAGNKRKGGAASFEELNKLAAERADGGAAGGMAGLEDMLGDLGGMDLGALMEGLDPNTLQELIAEGMKDPAIQEMMNGMQGAMDELLNMDSEELKTQMAEAMNMLTSMDMQQNILDQQEEVLAMMEAQGTATPEEIAEYRANPEKFAEKMSEAFGQMKEIFSDPKALDEVVQMMKGFGELMSDPKGAMSKLGSVLQDALADDEKIEEARLQLLSDPSAAGVANFDSEEMQDILRDPVKWRKSVKEGQRMMMGGGNGGVGMGEL
mmetsp:Transcript_1279/g.2082  ORF Transcript_1279/g.2082 Transcript_1279/m.2082 type:complete len:293 (+) Transcript_1279:76-954(+)|eukprot:CAMPEP_0113378736 /NCGR_PEP_ID=MMETSP0013_2-20120614/3859_1 /TAXON_ID=2843 ORGANISM="Skeletonema costatum, Strain 1716" /NCGR_SAMPLE_ID=MMETSP0013_2 /ASSEMBLY_ACC=CAM_ASM_000158 /LENGTH=292 /DNA_ID=CAMNT_0000260979 /DNA_START=83 /DNA_END=961 /DNA_ORIENTATION=+ /assembly_acc=CAM_ASM_000158